MANPLLPGGTFRAVETLSRPYQIPDLKPPRPTPVAPKDPDPVVSTRPDAFTATGEPVETVLWGTFGTTQEDYPDKGPMPDIGADGFLGTQRVTGSNFQVAGSNTKQTDRPKSSQDKQDPGVFVFDEIDRTVQRVTVWNIADPEQYVLVERVMSIRFRGPGGKIFKWNMRPPPPPVKPTDPTPSS